MKIIDKLLGLIEILFVRVMSMVVWRMKEFNSALLGKWY